MEFTVTGTDSTTGQTVFCQIEADSEEDALRVAETEHQLTSVTIIPDVEPIDSHPPPEEPLQNAPVIHAYSSNTANSSSHSRCSRDNRNGLKSVAGTVLGLSFLVFLFAMDPHYSWKFSDVTIGMTKSQVVAIMGEPGGYGPDNRIEIMEEEIRLQRLTQQHRRRVKTLKDEYRRREFNQQGGHRTRFQQEHNMQLRMIPPPPKQPERKVMWWSETFEGETTTYRVYFKDGKATKKERSRHRTSLF